MGTKCPRGLVGLEGRSSEGEAIQQRRRTASLGCVTVATGFAPEQPFPGTGKSRGATEASPLNSRPQRVAEGAETLLPRGLWEGGQQRPGAGRGGGRGSLGGERFPRCLRARPKRDETDDTPGFVALPYISLSNCFALTWN